MTNLKIKICSETAVIPTKATSGSAGYDLYVDSAEPVDIWPGYTHMFSTGIAVQIPEGYVGLIFARSGLSSKHGIRPSTCVSVIDSDYRGEIGLSLYNDSRVPYRVEAHERVAQMLIISAESPDIEIVDELDKTDRDQGGFGSTGR